MMALGSVSILPSREIHQRRTRQSVPKNPVRDIRKVACPLTGVLFMALLVE